MTNPENDKKPKHSRVIDQVLITIKDLLPSIAIFAGFLLILFLIARITRNDWDSFLNQSGVFVTLITAAVTLSTWFNVLRLRSAIPLPPDRAGDTAAILVIDIGHKDILGTVRLSCARDYKLRSMVSETGFSDEASITSLNSKINSYGYRIDIPNGTRIISVTSRYASDTEKLAEDVYRTFSWLDRALHKNGISELHVFYSGPVVVPFFLGELFSNSFATYIYKYVPGTAGILEGVSAGGSYNYIGKMDHIQYMEHTPENY